MASKRIKKNVESYNKLLTDKKVVDEDNSQLKQEIDEQKEWVLKIEEALTYVERQVTKLQNKQYCQSLPPPSSSD